MNIKYNRLCIRNAENKDCEQLAKWWNDGKVMAHAGFPKGLGKSVLSMLIEELFRMGAQLFLGDTNLNNTRAQHVYEELGFKKTATHYDSWRNQLGELQSSVDYELTKNDFCNLKSR